MMGKIEDMPQIGTMTIEMIETPQLPVLHIRPPPKVTVTKIILLSTFVVVVLIAATLIIRPSPPPFSLIPKIAIPQPAFPALLSCSFG